MESKDDKLVEMMDMMVRMELIKSLDNSLRSITDNFKDNILGDNLKTIPIDKLRSLSDALDNLNKITLKIAGKGENNNGEV